MDKLNLTTNQALIWAAKKLSRRKVGIPTVMSGKNHYDSPALDAEILLDHAAKRTKEELIINPKRKLSARQFKKFKNLIARRAKHEPVAYILGEKEFFGLKFKVNRSVLIPRPETELLVEESIKSYTLYPKPYTLIDVGTGSGAIAVALAKNIPKVKIIATDISVAALKIAKQNALRHSVSKKIKFVKADLLPQLSTLNSQLLTLIVANLPYLPTRVWQNSMPDVKKFEPKEALLGGTDGLDVIKRLLKEISHLQFKLRKVGGMPTSSRQKQNIHGMVLLEIDPSQKSKLQKFIPKIFPNAILEIKKDLAGLFRLVVIKI